MIQQIFTINTGSDIQQIFTSDTGPDSNTTDIMILYLKMDSLLGPRVFVISRLLKVANSRSLRHLLFVSTLQ